MSNVEIFEFQDSNHCTYALNAFICRMQYKEKQQQQQENFLCFIRKKIMKKKTISDCFKIRQSNCFTG